MIDSAAAVAGWARRVVESVIPALREVGRQPGAVRVREIGEGYFDLLADPQRVAPHAPDDLDLAVEGAQRALVARDDERADRLAEQHGRREGRLGVEGRGRAAGRGQRGTVH